MSNIVLYIFTNRKKVSRKYWNCNETISWLRFTKVRDFVIGMFADLTTVICWKNSLWDYFKKINQAGGQALLLTVIKYKQNTSIEWKIDKCLGSFGCFAWGVYMPLLLWTSQSFSLLSISSFLPPFSLSEYTVHHLISYSFRWLDYSNGSG